MSEVKKEKKSKKRTAPEDEVPAAEPVLQEPAKIETPAEDVKVKKPKKEKAKKEEKEEKKEKEESEEKDDDYDAKLLNVTVIAKPMADKKLTKKTYKLVKKAASKKVMKRGLKEVVKSIRKGASGLCILAGDVLPIDVISHIPVLCEEKCLPYYFVPSKDDLGEAAGSKRPTSIIYIIPNDDIKELYNECAASAKAINPSASLQA